MRMRNSAERPICTWNNHFIVGLCDVELLQEVLQTAYQQRVQS